MKFHIANIGKSLGKGTFGKVKLATHTLTGEKVSSLDLIYSMEIGGSENPRERQDQR